MDTQLHVYKAGPFTYAMITRAQSMYMTIVASAKMVMITSIRDDV